jgi:RHS repeat-associated protein
VQPVVRPRPLREQLPPVVVEQLQGPAREIEPVERVVGVGLGARAVDPTTVSGSRFLWDINHALPQLALERNPSGSLQRRYQHATGLHSMETAAGSFYYHADGLGSTTNLTNTTGAKQWSYQYEPFGTLRTETQDSPTAPANHVRFTGEYHDTTTGHYHLRARQYDPVIGRFLATDPVEPDLLDPYVSAYVYVNNQATVLIDPSGMIGLPKVVTRAIDFVDNNRLVIVGGTLVLCAASAPVCVTATAVGVGANFLLNARDVRNGEMTTGQLLLHTAIDVGGVGVGRALPHLVYGYRGTYMRLHYTYGRSYRMRYEGSLYAVTESAKLAAAVK